MERAAQETKGDPSLQNGADQREAAQNSKVVEQNDI
jgi:hypothetical protein